MARQNFVVYSGWLTSSEVQWISGEQETYVHRKGRGDGRKWHVCSSELPGQNKIWTTSCGQPDGGLKKQTEACCL